MTASRRRRSPPAPSLRALWPRLLPGASWRPWLAVVAAALGLPPEPGELEVFQQVTGRKVWPTAPVRELWVIAGRRSGKSRTAALLAVYVAAFKTHRVAPGEQMYAIVVAPDRRQATITLRYVKGFLGTVPALSRLIVRETQDTIELANDAAISVVTADFHLTRGRSGGIVIAEEAAFLDPAESAASDVELIRSLRPSLATSPDALLVVLSSPYARSGVLWDAHRDHFAQDDDPILVVQAATEVLNPTIDRQVIVDAYRADPESAQAEYGALFRNDIESLFTEAALDAVIVSGRLELPPQPGRSYKAFTDPSGGSADSFTLAISHSELDRAVLDCIREVKPPFSPEDTVRQYAELLQTYGISTVQADKYAGAWVVEAFAKVGIRCEQSAASKSEIYGALLAQVNSRRIELLDLPRLKAQLLGLERRTGRGRDVIDHRARGFDDTANATAGSLVECAAGDLRLPQDFDVCWYMANHPISMFGSGGCFLFQNGGTYLPSGDPSCRACKGWVFVKAAYADYLARGGRPIGHRAFHQQYVRLNDWAAARSAAWLCKTGIIG